MNSERSERASEITLPLRITELSALCWMGPEEFELLLCLSLSDSDLLCSLGEDYMEKNRMQHRKGAGAVSGVPTIFLEEGAKNILEGAGWLRRLAALYFFLLCSV